jgi:hypothetical protein
LPEGWERGWERERERERERDGWRGVHHVFVGL